MNIENEISPEELNRIIDDSLKKHIRQTEKLELYIRKTAVTVDRDDILKKLIKHHRKSIKKAKLCLEGIDS